jgi:hypothetical protein
VLQERRGPKHLPDWCPTPPHFVFNSIDVCLRGDEAETFISPLNKLPARKLRSLAIHLPNIKPLCSDRGILPGGWDRFDFYDTRPDITPIAIRILEDIAAYDGRGPPKMNVYVLGTKWKNAYLFVAADPIFQYGFYGRPWSPSPERKVQIKWLEDDKDPTCPPCVVCGEYKRTRLPWQPAGRKQDTIGCLSTLITDKKVNDSSAMEYPGDHREGIGGEYNGGGIMLGVLWGEYGDSLRI